MGVAISFKFKIASDAPAGSDIIITWPNPAPFTIGSSAAAFKVYLKWTAGNKEHIEEDLDGVTYAAGPPKVITFTPRHDLLAANIYELVLEQGQSPANPNIRQGFDNRPANF